MVKEDSKNASCFTSGSSSGSWHQSVTGAGKSAAPDLFRFLESAVRCRTPSLLIPASLSSTKSSNEAPLEEEKVVLSLQLHPDAADDAEEPEIPEQRSCTRSRKSMRRHDMLG